MQRTALLSPSSGEAAIPSLARRTVLAALACAVFVGLLALPAAAQDGEKIFPYDIHQHTLDNGLQVVIVPMKSGGLVSYWTIVRTGARDEFEEGRTGFAHFFEHMMFRGTEKYPADVYNAKITEIGADANAFTTDDLTAYHLSIAAEDLELVMDLESDRFQNLSYSKDVFQTEAGAVYGEYRKNRANPFFTLYEAVHQEAFDEHTYGHTAMGYVEDIQRMPTLFDHAQSFFSRFYRPENSILLITGDVQVDDTLDLVREYYGEWKQGYVEPQIPTEPEQKAEKRIEVPYEGATLPIVWMAYKFDAFDPADRLVVATDVLTDLLFGQTSDLHKKLVLEQQKVEFVAGGANVNRDPGLIDVYTRVKDPKDVDSVIAEIDAAIAKFRQTPPDAAQLDKLKSRAKYGFLMGLETPSQVASGLSRWLAVTADPDAVETYFRTLDAVTPEDVQAAAEKYFQNQRRTLAVLKGTR